LSLKEQKKFARPGIVTYVWLGNPGRQRSETPRFKNQTIVALNQTTLTLRNSNEGPVPRMQPCS
jgi:hypothetical protein